MTDGHEDVRLLPVMKPVCLTILFLSGWAGGVLAARVSFVTGGPRGHQFLQSDGVTRVAGTFIGQEGTVWVGYLGTAGDASSFQLFGETRISNPLISGGDGGHLSMSTEDNSAGTGGISVISGKQVVLWVFGQGGEQGMFISLDWKAPANIESRFESSYGVLLGISSPLAPRPPDVTTIPLPGFSAASYATPVSITLDGRTSTRSSSYILGSPIPEPTAFSLAGILTTLAFRRRR